MQKGVQRLFVSYRDWAFLIKTYYLIGDKAFGFAWVGRSVFGIDGKLQQQCVWGSQWISHGNGHQTCMAETTAKGLFWLPSPLLVGLDLKGGLSWSPTWVGFPVWGKGWLYWSEFPSVHRYSLEAEPPSAPSLSEVYRHRALPPAPLHLPRLLFPCLGCMILTSVSSG